MSAPPHFPAARWQNIPGPHGGSAIPPHPGGRGAPDTFAVAISVSTSAAADSPDMRDRLVMGTSSDATLDYINLRRRANLETETGNKRLFGSPAYTTPRGRDVWVKAARSPATPTGERQARFPDCSHYLPERPVH